MAFPLNVYLVASLSAFATALLSLPLWRKWCLKKGVVDDPGHRKIHDEPIPLAGGLAVLTGLLIPALIGAMLIWMFRSSPTLEQVTPQHHLHVPASQQNTENLLFHGLHRRAPELGAILLGALGMLTVGWLDDKRELRPSAKFGGQFFVALLVAASGARITLFVPNLIFSYAITVLWILTLINAFNFMDNMNGLCAGLSAIGAWFFGLIAASEGQYLVALIAFLTLGAFLGFLPFNFPRAKAFLGDSGSHLAGYLLSVLAILPHFYTPEHPRRRAVLVPLFVLAVPLLDMAWVVLLRWRAGKPFYVGDTNHLSHRLVRRGCSRTDAVMVIWLLASFCGSVGCWWLQ